MTPALALSAPVVGAMPAAGVRLYRLVGDVCSSLGLRTGDFLMVAETDRYHYETTYLLDCDGTEAPYLASPRPGGRMFVRHPTPWSQGQELSRADFDRAVRAVMVAAVRMHDEDLIRRAQLARAA